MIQVKNSGVMAAAAVLAGAVVLFGTVLTRAVLSTPAAEIPVAAPIAETVGSESPAPRTNVLGRIPRAELQRAADLAPFDPEREAPVGRYQLPGEQVYEVVAEAPPPPRELPAPPAFQVLGTAAGPDGGLAVIRIGDAAPRLIALGQEMEGYRVTAINAARVTMANSDRTLSLSVPSAVPNASLAASQRGRQGQAARPGQGNTNNANARAGAAQGGRGATAAGTNAATASQAAAQRAVAEQMIRQIQAGGAQGQIQIQSDGNRMTVTGPNGQTRVIAVPGAAGQNQVIFEDRVEIAPRPR
jgi:hypothetical protein